MAKKKEKSDLEKGLDIKLDENDEDELESKEEEIIELGGDGDKEEPGKDLGKEISEFIEGSSFSDFVSSARVGAPILENVTMGAQNVGWIRVESQEDSSPRAAIGNGRGTDYLAKGEDESVKYDVQGRESANMMIGPAEVNITTLGKDQTFMPERGKVGFMQSDAASIGRDSDLEKYSVKTPEQKDLTTLGKDSTAHRRIGSEEVKYDLK